MHQAITGMRSTGCNTVVESNAYAILLPLLSLACATSCMSTSDATIIILLLIAVAEASTITVVRPLSHHGMYSIYSAALT
jgi:hypothetical protein